MERGEKRRRKWTIKGEKMNERKRGKNKGIEKE